MGNFVGAWDPLRCTYTPNEHRHKERPSFEDLFCLRSKMEHTRLSELPNATPRIPDSLYIDINGEGLRWAGSQQAY